MNINIDYHKKILIEKAVAKHSMKKDMAADLGVTVPTLNRLIKKYGIETD